MPLKLFYEKTLNGQKLQSGHFYTFRYGNYENDPQPLIIFINAIVGINDSTGHYWNLFQGINLHYISRNKRRVFLNDWLRIYDHTKGNLKFTWQLITKQYPYLALAIRRYILNTTRGFIIDLREIKRDNISSTVLGSLPKDYSAMVIPRVMKYRKMNPKRRKKR